MASGEIILEVQRGEDFSQRILITQRKLPVDLSSATVLLLLILDDRNDDESAAIDTEDLLLAAGNNLAAGVVDINLPTATTNALVRDNYFWRLRITDTTLGLKTIPKTGKGVLNVRGGQLA